MRILVGVDGGPGQRDALAFARNVASCCDGNLVLGHVYSTAWLAWASGPHGEDSVRHNAKQVIERAGADLGADYEPALGKNDSPARGLKRLAADVGADLIVVGSSRRGRPGRLALGGVAESLVSGTPCAVALAPLGYSDDAAEIRRVGVAWDGSAEAERAVDWATATFGGAGAKLTLYRLFEEPAMPTYPLLDSQPALQNMRDAYRRKLEERAARTGAEAQLLEGSIRDAMHHASEREDVVVSGSRGYGPVRRVVLGSVSGRLMRVAECPVVVLPRGGSAAGEDDA